MLARKRCARCGSKWKLVVHHRDRTHGNNARSNLEVLCRRCHRLEHAPEINAGQRRSDVNARRGAAISAARSGNNYPKTAAAMRRIWRGPVGARLRRKHNSHSTRRKHSETMTRRWRKARRLGLRNMRELRLYETR